MTQPYVCLIHQARGESENGQCPECDRERGRPHAGYSDEGTLVLGGHPGASGGVGGGGGGYTIHGDAVGGYGSSGGGCEGTLGPNGWVPSSLGAQMLVGHPIVAPQPRFSEDMKKGFALGVVVGTIIQWLI